MKQKRRSTNTPGVEAAGANLIESIEKDDFDRYPDRTRIIAADLPSHGKMATEALFAGQPVVLVYPDRHEVLLTPERVRGVAALFLRVAVFWLRLRSKRADGQVVQLPPRTRIEARDSHGTPVAA